MNKVNKSMLLCAALAGLATNMFSGSRSLPYPSREYFDIDEKIRAEGEDINKAEVKRRRKMQRNKAMFL